MMKKPPEHDAGERRARLSCRHPRCWLLRSSHPRSTAWRCTVTARDDYAVRQHARSRLPPDIRAARSRSSISASRGARSATGSASSLLGIASSVTLQCGDHRVRHRTSQNCHRDGMRRRATARRLSSRWTCNSPRCVSIAGLALGGRATATSARICALPSSRVGSAVRDGVILSASLAIWRADFSDHDCPVCRSRLTGEGRFPTACRVAVR